MKPLVKRSEVLTLVDNLPSFVSEISSKNVASPRSRDSRMPNNRLSPQSPTAASRLGRIYTESHDKQHLKSIGDEHLSRSEHVGITIESAPETDLVSPRAHKVSPKSKHPKKSRKEQRQDVEFTRSITELDSKQKIASDNRRTLMQNTCSTPALQDGFFRKERARIRKIYEKEQQRQQELMEKQEMQTRIRTLVQRLYATAAKRRRGSDSSLKARRLERQRREQMLLEMQEQSKNRWNDRLEALNSWIHHCSANEANAQLFFDQKPILMRGRAPCVALPPHTYARPQ